MFKKLPFRKKKETIDDAILQGEYIIKAGKKISLNMLALIFRCLRDDPQERITPLELKYVFDQIKKQKVKNEPGKKEFSNISHL
jgi:hypothetical protein